MLLSLNIIIDADKDYAAGETFERLRIVFALDLVDCALGCLVVFEFNNNGGTVRLVE